MRLTYAAAGWFVLCAGVVTTPAALAACTLDVESLPFGAFLAEDGGESTTKVVARCDAPVALEVRPVDGDGERRMSGSGGDLRYDLFIDRSHTVRFGDGSGSSQALVGVSDGEKPNEWRLYGKVFRDQSVSAGIFSDSVVLELRID
jgi:spore coat protein U-like protein